MEVRLSQITGGFGSFANRLDAQRIILYPSPLWLAIVSQCPISAVGLGLYLPTAVSSWQNQEFEKQIEVHYSLKTLRCYFGA